MNKIDKIQMIYCYFNSDLKYKVIRQLGKYVSSLYNQIWVGPVANNTQMQNYRVTKYTVTG